MTHPPWAPALEALDRARAAGHRVEVWLRDDDATSVTGDLDRLADLCEHYGMPILLAVIPARAEGELAPWIDRHPAVTPCQHGYAHANHAASGDKARELGGARPIAEVLDELRRGRGRMRSLFEARLSDILVPPWNRIDGAVVPHLTGLGFTALSTFGPLPTGSVPVVPRLNCDLDIVDWRHGRVGRSAKDVASKLATLIDASHGLPIGLLTHHLVHDVAAWQVLEEMLAMLERHPAAHFLPAAALLRRESLA